MKNLFIFGLGYSGKAIAQAAMGPFETITGTSRQKSETADIPGISSVVFDGTTLNAEVSKTLQQCTHLLISIAPNDEGDPVLNACEEFLKQCKNLQWIGYLSTVGVYGDHDGEWIDESTICKPVSKRSIQRLDAEKAWQTIAEKLHIPLAIFRLAGIYGPGRNAFVNIEKGTARRLVKSGQVFNRIHRDDIARAVNLAMAKNIGGAFNITDDEPAPPQDVVVFAHELAGVTPPPEIDFETAELSPMARSFYGENKRVSNARSKTILGMEYLYPNYRIALEALWKTKL